MDTKPKTSVCAASCKCVFCPRCARATGLRLREKLFIVFATMRHIQMWTLTVDPKRFEHASEAYIKVAGERMIAELVRQLRKDGVLISRHYFVMLEFHESGWPHWHLVLNTKFVDKFRFQEIWNRLGTGDPDENFGFVAFSKGSSKGFQSALHAARYVTKYIIKQPKHGYPSWVMKRSNRIRRYSTSRLLFEEMGHIPQVKEEAKREREKYKMKKTIELRVAACGQGYRVFMQSDVGVWRFVVELPHTYEQMEGFFTLKDKTIVLPEPGQDAFVDCLFWSWLEKSHRPKCIIKDGQLEPLDWNVHPDQWQDEIDNSPPPFASFLGSGVLTLCG